MASYPSSVGSLGPSQQNFRREFLNTNPGTVTSVATGTGLTGGPIVDTGTISLANTAVAAGTYGDATNVSQVTVDAQGRVTAAVDVSIPLPPLTLSQVSVGNVDFTADLNGVILPIPGADLVLVAGNYLVGFNVTTEVTAANSNYARVLVTSTLGGVVTFSRNLFIATRTVADSTTFTFTHSNAFPVILPADATLTLNVFKVGSPTSFWVRDANANLAEFWAMRLA